MFTPSNFSLTHSCLTCGFGFRRSKLETEQINALKTTLRAHQGLTSLSEVFVGERETEKEQLELVFFLFPYFRLLALRVHALEHPRQAAFSWILSSLLRYLPLSTTLINSSVEAFLPNNPSKGVAEMLRLRGRQIGMTFFIESLHNTKKVPRQAGLFLLLSTKPAA